ncbi:zinc-ribbon domain-containing protein [Streptomyces pseudovenezuelae]|uniref:zinc-ribbon domain-containing protein n=1 Tax=Streptomyces pseudovenezuelae TaxID=67350 RepID=UPI002E3627A2|nr:zinc-ribbon domain-containing protein [Streptomyces pseudovenezuelae]
MIAAEFKIAVNGTTPDEIFSQDNRRYVWKCSKVPSHRWPASPNNRVGKKSGCPYCSGARVWEANRLGDLRPDLLERWDSDRNGTLTPWMVSVGSSRKVHWKCPEGQDHRWRARVYKRTAGQGCRFCAGHEASETTSLLALRPDLAAQLDAEKSGISAAELTLGSNQVVHWICPVNPEEHTWPAKVLNRTLNGTGCRDCNLPGTSAQEVRLAAELGTVLDVAFGRHTIRTDKRVERVDIYVPSLSLVLEFDGSYWHESTEEADAAKARRLRTVVKHVVRIREQPLECLDPVHDVVVPFQSAPEMAAGTVLEHLANLAVIPRATVEEYLRLPGPRAADRAEQILADLLRRAQERKAAKDEAPIQAAAEGDGQPSETPTLW